MKVFGINFSQTQLHRDAFLAALNTMPEIRNWLTLNETMVLVVTEVDSIKLSDMIYQRFPTLTFIVFEADPMTTNGRQTANVWEFINNPKESGYWNNPQPMQGLGIKK